MPVTAVRGYGGRLMGRITRGLILGTLAGSLVASAAQAGGFAIREQSARGQGTSFAGAAAGGAGLGSMFWNPAIITQYNGWQTQSNATLILPEAKVQLNATIPALGAPANSGILTQGAVDPASYMSYQLTDKIWLGFLSNSRFGLVTKYPPNGPWQLGARTSKVFSV
jgi:long-chain fatty acid transport protein